MALSSNATKQPGCRPRWLPALRRLRRRPHQMLEAGMAMSILNMSSEPIVFWMISTIAVLIVP